MPIPQRLPVMLLGRSLALTSPALTSPALAASDDVALILGVK